MKNHAPLRPSTWTSASAVLSLTFLLQACGSFTDSSEADRAPVFFAAGTLAASKAAEPSRTNFSHNLDTGDSQLVPLNAITANLRAHTTATAQPSTVTNTAVMAVSTNATRNPSLGLGSRPAVETVAPSAPAHTVAAPKPAAVPAPATVKPAAPSTAQAATPVAVPRDAEPRLQTITPELLASLAQERRSDRENMQRFMGAVRDYRIGAGDVLSIAVWGYPEFSMSTMTATTTGTSDAATAGSVGFLVDAAGDIQFPFVGKFRVAGLTEADVYSKLSTALGRMVRNPQLTVRVQNYRSQRVYIDGEVKTPGVYSITDLPMSLPEAINRAGGALTTGDLSRLQLTRSGSTYTVNYTDLVAQGVNPNRVILASGDMLRLPSRDESKVYVIGEVQKPSALLMQNGKLTLNAALGEAAGVSPIVGNARQVYVVRTRSNAATGARPTIYHLDARTPAALILAEQFDLQAKDVVYVDASTLASWNRVISLILPTAALIKAGDDLRK
ncbi:MAG: polysaccharide biosynthesis/export family protein [Brachymonas sp.]|jgi:polysaccharide export outer membrane protein